MIPIAIPVTDDAEAAAVQRFITSGWNTQGPKVAALEGEFAEFFGAPHACAVSNCTMALHLVLLISGALSIRRLRVLAPPEWLPEPSRTLLPHPTVTFGRPT